MLAAKRLGADRIIALSRHADRQALAREFGATDVVEQRGDEATEAVIAGRTVVSRTDELRANGAWIALPNSVRASEGGVVQVSAPLAYSGIGAPPWLHYDR